MTAFGGHDTVDNEGISPDIALYSPPHQEFRLASGATQFGGRSHDVTARVGDGGIQVGKQVVGVSQ
jgi:hypothetical protein